MKRTLLIGYQLVTGLSDTLTGLLLIAAPDLTLQLMKVHIPAGAGPFLSYIGIFVLSTGLACLYGGGLAMQRAPGEKLAVVWLLTGMTRGLVALFVAFKVASGTLEPGWVTVAVTDGAFALIQFFGLARGWTQYGGD